MSDRADDITALRLALRANGYFPVPVSGPDMNVPSAGKRPLMAKWQTRCLDASIEDIARWARVEPASINTGLLTGVLAAVDIDVLDAALAARIEALAVLSLGQTPLRRIGRAPKVLLCYRLAVPTDKLQSPALTFTADPAEKPTRVEVLGRGQQFVAFGIHPETRQPYAWSDGSPLTVPFEDVPEVEPASLRQFLADVEDLIREAGGLTQADRRRTESKRGNGGAPRRRLQGRRATGPADHRRRIGACSERPRLRRVGADRLRALCRTRRERPRSLGGMVRELAAQRPGAHDPEVVDFRAGAFRHDCHPVLARRAERMAQHRKTRTQPTPGAFD